MPAEFYFQLLNPLVFLLFAGGLLATHIVRPSRSALLLSISYFVGALAFAVDIVNSAFPPFFGVIPTTSLYALCAVIASAGFCLRYLGRAPWGLLIAVAAIHMAIYSFLHLRLENFWFRSIEANIGGGAILLVALISISGRQQRLIDRVLYALLAITVAQCFLRPWLVVALSGGAMTPASYSESIFLVTLHLAFGLCAIMTGMALLITYSFEIIEDLKDRSVRDVLSGVLNRRGFEDAAQAVAFESDRLSAPVGIIIADIDRFKQINDTHGHGLGDLVIAEIGALFALYADEKRIAGRIGGEEFALVLPQEDGIAAAEVAEAIRRDIEAIEVETLEGVVRFTASFGVAERRPGEDFRYAVAKADEALYLAKAAGRNRVFSETDVGIENLKAARDKLERRRNRAARMGAPDGNIERPAAFGA